MSTLVIKNMPDKLHKLLKVQAERNHRSVTKEAIRLLESGLAPSAVRRPLPEPIDLRSGRMQTIEEFEAAVREGTD